MRYGKITFKCPASPAGAAARIPPDALAFLLDRCMELYSQTLICKNHGTFKAEVTVKKDEIEICVSTVGASSRSFIINRADGTRLEGQIIVPAA